MSASTLHALIRPVSASFADALVARRPEVPIAVATAREQHGAYCDALAAAGRTVAGVAGDDGCPDACFVEDTAVVAAGLAVVTRPGAASRRPEVDAVAEAVARFVEVVRMEAPATLDGGDCLRLGHIIYVGLSARTNREGVEQLARFFAPRGVTVVAVPLPASILHLKCVVSPLAADRVLLADGTLAPGTFGGAHVVRVPAEESYAANALALGERVIMADGFPRARAAVERAGYQVTAIETSEFRKADGALTCLSILID
jgi:dimethylargininase